MSLVSGTKLGPYEIGAPLGAGGMGEVYRARDTRLGRDVAVKILPAEFSADPVRKQRFEREAKTVSSLNHPHICVLHDVGSQDGISYLVMECVEGETLAKRLEKGPLPLEQVLKYGAQIADALDKAHRGGVVHRDLKPGNIMLTASGAKLLDFGLAKPVVAPTNGAALTATLTEITPATREGTVVGTFQYMSPEQVEGKEVDGRSDIFSLGAVLYEMVTGKRAFEGKSHLSVASAILEKEPTPICAVKPTTPLALDHVIRKCLAKVPEDRWQSSADIKHEISWISQTSTEASLVSLPQRSRPIRSRLLAFALGAAVLAAVAVAVIFFTSRRAVSAPIVRATIMLPPDISLLTVGDQSGAPAISPDGSNLLFVAVAGEKQMLFVRSMVSGTVKPLPGTEEGKFPFWSPDGKSIGFFADQQLKRLDLAGGPPLNLAPAPDGRGGTWSGDAILFVPFIYEAVYRVPASGGKPVAVTTVHRPQHTTHRWPHFLPDGEHFLYLAANHLSDRDENTAIYAGSIDGGNPKFIVHTNGSAFYSLGNLLWFRDGSLMAQEFDAKHMELLGDPRPIGPVLREGGNWGVIASASDNGVLLFQSPGEVKYPVSWLDIRGKTIGPAPISAQLADLRLSPDMTRAATVEFGTGKPSGELAVYDLQTGARTRLTFREDAWYVAWSPDGKRIAYSVEDQERQSTEIYVKRSDGAGERELLLSSGNIDHPTDWTRDGQFIVFDRGPLGSQSVWILPMFGDRKAFPLFANAAYDHHGGRVSPDGNWIAYLSEESGYREVYLTSFAKGIGRWQVAGHATSPPRWRADGTEIYFVTVEGFLTAASIRGSEGSITVEGIRQLSRSPFLNGRVGTVFDVDPRDGRRFIGSSAPDATSLPLNVITNWDAETRKR